MTLMRRQSTSISRSCWVIPILPGLHCRLTVPDVDNDGDLDLLLHFRIRDLVDAGAIDNATQSLGLTGSTLDGTGIGGLDVVTIVP